MNEKLVKVYRYSRILGLKRTIIKIFGRLRKKAFPVCLLFGLKRRIFDCGVIGCGQFSFSTILYFLYDRTHHGVSVCYDTNRAAAESLARFYDIPKIAADMKDFYSVPGLKRVFIASDHATHAPYAIETLKHGLNVHLEKPIAISMEQLDALLAAQKTAKGHIYCGYNRPYSAAIRTLAADVKKRREPFSLNMHIAGHMIPPDHWYRNPTEGTRICGNVGHWLDMAVHLMASRGSLPDCIHISLNWADAEEQPDDNISIGLSTDQKDIIHIMLTSRCDPFEGINESIDFQCGSLNAKIDDFRSMQIWVGSKYKRYTYHPKDVGHSKSVLQVLDEKEIRDWNEVIYSTALMLKIKDMVLIKQSQGVFCWTTEKKQLHSL